MAAQPDHIIAEQHGGATDLVNLAFACFHCLEADDYCPQLPDAQGVLHRRACLGRQLSVAPLLACATAKILAALTEPKPLNTKPPPIRVKSEH